ncbi:MAG TPA: hypothetical protein VKB34_22815, partial [Povalibacter sp.]|nr:hypothetical protein [Povalibacter sp.]
MRLEHIAAHGRTVALLGAGLLWAATLDCLAANGENGAAASGAKQCAAPGALQTQPSPADCTLCVRNNPLIIAGADGTASATLQLCNKGPDKKLQLSVEDFRAYSPRGATFPLGATRTLNAELASQQDIREGKAPLATDTCIGLKLDAAKLNAAGSMSSALWNGDERLIDLKAVRYQVPFNLKVDGGTGEAVAVAINGADAAGHIALRNEDPIAYCVSWRLELDGRVDSHDVIVPAGGSVDLPFKLRNGR